MPSKPVLSPTMTSPSCAREAPKRKLRFHEFLHPFTAGVRRP